MKDATGPADNDEEQTVVRPRAARMAAAPAASASARPSGSHVLVAGSRLRDHEITGLIGEGGFGIVYLAWDHSLQRKVAIKEYMPAAMASRIAGSSAVVVKSDRHLDTFRAGLRSFVNEARLLARFDHPSLVKVYRFWEENGTAYMVMPFYEGPTLKSALAELGHVPTEAELRTWLKPLLDALAVLHAARCFHRDVAPDNILLTPRGPLLLDFGAARRVIGDMTHALTVVLKPGFAPIEQYGDVATMAQGAWTDLYALASVVYYAITGHTPTSSVERLMDDRLAPLAVTHAGRYGDGFLRAIDSALAVRPNDRPQDVEAFRARLDAGLPPAPAERRPAPLSHSDFVSSFGDYSTVPGTLMPVLPTELHVRGDAAVDSSDAGLGIDGTDGDGSNRAANLVATVEGGGAIAPTVLLPRPMSAAATVPSTAGPRRVAFLVALSLVAVAALAFFAWRSMAPDRGGVTTGDAATSATAPPGPAASATASLTPPVTPSVTTMPPGLAQVQAVSAPASVSVPALASGVASAPAIERRSMPSSPRASAPVARRTRDELSAQPTARPPARAAEPRRQTLGARCSDILQKASLEPLTGDEAAYLKRECR